jgi:nicotinate-nucleotide pyrophosphorylase (carboxylating)
MISASPSPLLGPPDDLIVRSIAMALDEDLGLAGDITTAAIIARDQQGTARIISRGAGILAGSALAREAFARLDPNSMFDVVAEDGAHLEPGGTIAEVRSRIDALLGAERVALNFLGHLSGIATLTRAYVDAVAGTKARIVCTRKTTPGLRALQKYAVRVGGGVNHRFGLFDAMLIKDNHIAAAGGVSQAIRRARAAAGHLVRIEIEVDTLEQLDAVLAEPVDAVLLDNMGPDRLREAVARIGGRMIAEASGGVSLETVRDIALSGVDLISVGALTHSAPVLDIGLDYGP